PVAHLAHEGGGHGRQDHQEVDREPAAREQPAQRVTGGRRPAGHVGHRVAHGPEGARGGGEPRPFPAGPAPRQPRREAEAGDAGEGQLALDLRAVGRELLGEAGCRGVHDTTLTRNRSDYKDGNGFSTAWPPGRLPSAAYVSDAVPRAVPLAAPRPS